MIDNDDSDLVQQWINDGKRLGDLPPRVYVVNRQIVGPPVDRRTTCSEKHPECDTYCLPDGTHPT